MKICYLTWGETPRSYGVFGSQVIGQFVETSRVMPDIEFYFISGVPIIHSGLTREKFIYRQEIKKIKAKLGKIKFLRIPIFATQNFVISTKRTFELLHKLSDRILANKLLKIQPNIVHCRSYHATWAALQAKKNNGLSYKIVFDSRGLYPEEIALKKGWDSDNENYQFLKEIEKKLLLDSDMTIVVSDTMQTHFSAIGVKKVKLIYLSADTKKLASDKNKSNKQVIFTYVGALEEGTWHKPNELLQLYQKLREVVSYPKLIIATKSNHENLRNIFKEIPSDELELTSFTKVEELRDILERSDFGLMSYFTPKTEKDKMLSEKVLSIKFVEYICAGLPVIINKTCGGASYLVENYKLGINYNPNTFEEITQENIFKFLNDGNINERVALAKELFDYKSNAKRYCQIYKSLMS